MAEKQFKTKDMIIAVICTLLAILSIVFYFLPAFTVEHSPSLNFEISEKLSYSAWDLTKAVFTSTKDWGSSLIGLLYIKDVYGVAVLTSGLLMPIGIIFIITTAVFAYLSWFKGEKFKKFCFLFSLCGMVFTTITLISTWYLAIQLSTNASGRLDYFAYNIKGAIAYASFVSLIIAFVVAIVACAYYYFLDNFDDEDDEDEEDDEEEKKVPEKVAEEKVVNKDSDEDKKENVTKASAGAETKTTTNKSSTKQTTKTTTKSKSTK